MISPSSGRREGAQRRRPLRPDRHHALIPLLGHAQLPSRSERPGSAEVTVNNQAKRYAKAYQIGCKTTYLSVAVALTGDELRALLAKPRASKLCEDHDLVDPITLLIATGLRRSELLGRRWTDQLFEPFRFKHRLFLTPAIRLLRLRGLSMSGRNQERLQTGPGFTRRFDPHPPRIGHRCAARTHHQAGQQTRAMGGRRGHPAPTGRHEDRP